MSPPQYLITGATGWLGRRVVRALTVGNPELGPVAAGGERVRILAPAEEDVRNFLAFGVETIRGDVRDPKAAADFVKGAEGAALLHLAGVIHPPGRTYLFEEVNVQGTANVLRAARRAGIRRSVVMSSNSAFGANASSTDLFEEESPYNPYMGYGRSKAKMEVDSKAIMGEAEIVIVRAPWFYGPEQPARQSRFFSLIKAGRFPLFGKGENRRSMGYVDSLALGILLAATKPIAAGRSYWLADERAYPMREVVETVCAVLSEDFGMKTRGAAVRLPGVIADCARLADLMLQRVGLYSQEIHVLGEMNLTIACSIARAQAELGYRPITDLREGMRRSVEWCLANNMQI